MSWIDTSFIVVCFQSNLIGLGLQRPRGHRCCVTCVTSLWNKYLLPRPAPQASDLLYVWYHFAKNNFRTLTQEILTFFPARVYHINYVMNASSAHCRQCTYAWTTRDRVCTYKPIGSPPNLCWVVAVHWNKIHWLVEQVLSFLFEHSLFSFNTRPRKTSVLNIWPARLS